MEDRAEIVKNLLLEWKIGRVWPLSKVYPFEGRGQFGDFENFSFEEVRYNFYNAKSNGTLNEYITQLTNLKNEVAMKIDFLIKRPESMYPLISNMPKIDNDPTQTINSNSNGNRFDNLKSNMASTISNPFSAPVFGGTVSTLSASVPGNTVSPFSVSAPGTTVNPFSASVPGNAVNPFSASAPNNAVNPFSASIPANSANSGFSFMQSAKGIFKQNSQSYQQSTSATPLNNQTAPLFNNVFTNTLPTPHVQMGTEDAEIYSKIEDLTEAEITAFKAEFFEIGKIPVKPPPLNMC